MRAQPLHGGPGGGRSGYVYGLSDAGAKVLTALAGIPRADIPTVAGPGGAGAARHESPANGQPLTVCDPFGLPCTSRRGPVRVDGRSARMDAVPGRPDVADRASRHGR